MPGRGRQEKYPALPLFHVRSGSKPTEKCLNVKIKVQYLGLIKNLIKRSEDEFDLKEGCSLSALLNRLADVYGEPFKKEVYEPGLKDMKMGFVVTVNGVLMGQLHGVDTRLSEGDNVILMSLMSGG
jgi:molybdopterin converting factor small subunit